MRLFPFLFCPFWVLLLSLISPLVFAAAQAESAPGFSSRMQALERSLHGTIGVSVLNTTNGKRLQYNGNRRFAMCSTYKWLLVAAVLYKSEKVAGLLNRKLDYQARDIVPGYSPMTRKHLAQGMTVAELSQAAVLSDNAAANLLLEQVIGSPSKLNVFVRQTGDHRFRLDRIEPAVNTAIPGDARDTTTPNAMTEDLTKIVLGDVLAKPQRAKLQSWLKANNTGDARIRAAAPQTWIIGDKTGTCAYGTTNDVGVIWPPHCSPIVISVFFTQSQKNAKPRDEVVAKIARLAL